MSRIVLVGCGKSKGAERVPARDLYTGSLFAASRKYAEATGSPWYIVSAKHGLLPAKWCWLRAAAASENWTTRWTPSN